MEVANKRGEKKTKEWDGGSRDAAATGGRGSGRRGGTEEVMRGDGRKKLVCRRKEMVGRGEREGDGRR